MSGCVIVFSVVNARGVCVLFSHMSVGSFDFGLCQFRTSLVIVSLQEVYMFYIMHLPSTYILSITVIFTYLIKYSSNRRAKCPINFTVYCCTCNAQHSAEN
jgi:K+-sensing histidine kinase KdpD